PDPLRVVVVTIYDLDENLHAALRAGACGFLLKDAGPRLLVEAVHVAARGESLVSPQITTRLLRDFAREGGPRARPATRTPLTARELDVALAVARGGTNAEIAQRLSITLSTVKSHLTSVQQKLGARNRTEVAIRMWEDGLVR
ncbi:LuxR C-terminal-related transcriptional regulator, partial [Actinosynnema sp.]|uniref:LuxR C-terminal-related transcriptional regulator n=1 Tax=Actinosynnema sp. TaxID=1872144 RepID=UPI003F8601CC